MYDTQPLSHLKLAHAHAHLVCLVTRWTQYELGTTPLKPLRCKADSRHTMGTVAQSYQSWTSTTPHSNPAPSRVSSGSVPRMSKLTEPTFLREMGGKKHRNDPLQVYSPVWGCKLDKPCPSWLDLSCLNGNVLFPFFVLSFESGEVVPQQIHLK